MQKRLQSFSFPILAGIFIGTSYIPLPPWALLFCVTPLWIFWTRTNSLKKIFIGGWITQFILNLIGFHWIAYTTVEFGRMPWPLGLCALFLFCTLAHLYYPIAGVLWKWISRKLQLSDLASLLILPLVFILCERLYPFLFYWHLGYPWLWASFPGLQTAEWIGFFGLNLFTLYLNLCFVFFWIKRKPGQWIQKHSVLAIALFLAINLIGLIKSSTLPEPDKELNVVVVQGNIGNLEKASAELGNGYVGKIVTTFIDLTEKALSENPNADLVIWPETAFPELLQENRLGYHRRRLSKLTTQYGVPLLTGAYVRKPGGRQTYNGLVLIDGDKNIGSYEKTHLLAFGEYLPFGDWFPSLKKMLPTVADFGRGLGPSIIPFEKAAIGAQICYEGLFDEFSTGLQEKGAQILVNVTNDSWFGYPFEPYQHMYMTLARAVENRRPLVRVTNTGITTAILADGTVLEHSPRDVPWYKSYRIPFASTPPNTFYVRLSKNWPWILILFIGLIIGGDKIARTGKH